MGRYIGFRLHPFSWGECLSPGTQSNPDDILQIFNAKYSTYKHNSLFDDLWTFGGFPEPLFRQSHEFANIWRRGRIEKLIREDLRDLSRIPELSQVEMLVALLPDRIGSLLIIQSLREDLEVAHDTVKRWIDYLKQLYYLFELKPYSKSLPRSLKKEGKIYLYDWAEVDSQGPRFENMVACHLLKACHFWTDIGKGRFELHYLRNKEKKEVDFLVLRDRKPWITVECKLSDMSFDPSILSFSKQLGIKHHIQLHKGKQPKVRADQGDLKVVLAGASEFLSLLP